MSANQKCDDPAGELVHATSCEVVRCVCGSLLARYVAGQIELKCRRCKRTVMVSIEGEGGDVANR